MRKRRRNKTIGKIAQEAKSDAARIDPLELGHAMTDDILDNLYQCVANHNHIINENEYCVVLALADDPLIKGVLRRKFYAWPYLPSPRPRQACFLYNKTTNNFRRLWILPQAGTMATLAEAPFVAKQWHTMQAWSIAFFKGTFWEYIRHEHGIDLLSEKEYLQVNREKFIKAGCQDVAPGISQPFDFSKVKVDQIVNPEQVVLN